MTTSILAPGARIAGAAEEGARHEVRRPADGSSLGWAGWVGPETVPRVVAAAVAARPGWAGTPARDRATALRGIAAGLRELTDELASLIAAESGKRLAEARAEVGFSAAYFDWFAEAAAQAEVEQGRIAGGRRFRVRHQPVGVVAAVATWNFPLSIPARKLAAAIAAGCPVVLKASERTPLTADRLVRLCEQHLPVGVVGSVMGDGAELSGALIDHPDVAAVTFTGSTAVGRQVARRCAGSFTRVVLELGGRAPFVVRADADVADAVEHLLVAKLRNNGESCIAANNVFVHASVHREFLDVLSRRLSTIQPGDPHGRGTDLGPLIDTGAVQRLEELVAEAGAGGARVLRGPDGPTGGSYLAAVLVECDGTERLWREEVFGPVLALRAYTEEDEVVAEVSSWGLGLAGYVCGTDVGAAEALAERLPVGIVGINTGAPNTPEVPFGGFGASGLGREGGMSGYRAFVEEQTLSVAR